MVIKDQIVAGDCLEILRKIDDESINLIYLDPPFFTQKKQQLKTRDRKQEFSYDDLWGCHQEYSKFLFERIEEMRRVMKTSGSIFVHCDKNASHIVRAILDQIFSEDNFRSEIIWTYKRWSNAKKGLLPAHQTIYYYSKSAEYTFNIIYKEYSESTNVDQILQKRARDEHGKATYAKNENGNIIFDDEKEGVPLNDVWDIPYLNPKAKERVGYPTQKPILLLEKIIELASNPGDIVLDPFCGSGTTLVAAKMLGRRYLGIDQSEDAIKLSQGRLEEPIKSESKLIKQGRDTYLTADWESLSLLRGLDYIPIHRNQGIDAILKQQYQGTPVLIRIQKPGESLSETLALLAKAAEKKGSLKSFLIETTPSNSFFEIPIPHNVEIIKSTAQSLIEALEKPLTKISSET